MASRKSLSCKAIAIGAVVIAGAVLVQGCAGRGRPAKVRPAQSWKAIATDRDRDRIRQWRSVFMQALAKANAGHAREIAAAGSPLQPDAALGGARPPPGDYACRFTKLGAQGTGGTDYASFPNFHCRISVEPDGLHFAKLDGSQRPAGLLLPDEDDRMIFLGSMMLGDERQPLRYGRDAQRDMAGLFQRIGANRWRLVLPSPAWESMLDVIDLVPVAS